MNCALQFHIRCVWQRTSATAIAHAEQAVAETLRTNPNRAATFSGLGLVPGNPGRWVTSGPDDRVARRASLRTTALDSFARESRKFAALLPADPRWIASASNGYRPLRKAPARPTLRKAGWLSRRLGQRRGAGGAVLSLLRDHLQHRAAGAPADAPPPTDWRAARTRASSPAAASASSTR